MALATIRNTVIAVGTYTCGRWCAVLLGAALYRTLGTLMMRRGGHASDVLVGSLVASLPDAIGAALSGGGTALLVDSRHPTRWVLVTAACWVLFFAGDALVAAPTWIDVITQSAIAALPAMVCIGAGRMALWHRERR